MNNHVLHKVPTTILSITIFLFPENAMEDLKGLKSDILNSVSKSIGSWTKAEMNAKLQRLEKQLFDFANFIESKIIMMYMARPLEVDTTSIINRCLKLNKIIVLPVQTKDKFKLNLFKIDNLKEDVKSGLKGNVEPDPDKCKKVPIKHIDIAIIPGVAFDEKGGRMGQGDGFYDRLIPKLPITTRKVALAFDEQILQQVPMESANKHVDIIITETRVIYKI